MASVDPSYLSAVNPTLRALGLAPIGEVPPPPYTAAWVPPTPEASLPPPYPSCLQSLLDLAGRINLFIVIAIQTATLVFSALAIAGRTTPTIFGGILIVNGAYSLLSNIISLIKHPDNGQRVSTYLAMTVSVIELLVGGLSLSGVIPLKSAGWVILGQHLAHFSLRCCYLSYECQSVIARIVGEE